MKNLLARQAFCLLLSLVFLHPSHAATMITKVVQLEHRFSDELIPEIRPLLIEGASVNGHHDQLIIHSTKNNLQQVLRTLKVLDQELRSLRISVQFRDQPQQAGRTGNKVYSTSGSSDPIKTSGSGPGQHHWKTTADEDIVYFIRTLEGKAAWIRNTESQPLTNIEVSQGPCVEYFRAQREYHRLQTGFYVVAHLRGEHARVKLSPQQSYQDRDYAKRFQEYQAQSSLEIPLGVWTEMASVGFEQQQSAQTTRYRTHRAARQEKHIFVKVDRIN